MKANKRKRYAVRNAAVDILNGNEPISLQILTLRIVETTKAPRGQWKITPQIVAQTLRMEPRIKKYSDKRGISMYHYE